MTRNGKNISLDVNMSDLLVFLKHKRGRASELAKHLGVPLPQLSNWTHGRFTPGSDVLERMSAWMAAATAQEATEKADAEAKTRSAINNLRR